ncbi:hypothetical protein HOY80DRAFT_1023082 [Tuber brumale]|nr:hypothetical protein HOY80DRAFT_1023082 [Tuber brumale]
MPFFSKLSRHHKYSKLPTTTGNDPPKNLDTEAIVALTGHAQILLSSLRDIRSDFYLIHHNIRLFTPTTPETRRPSKGPREDPHPQSENEEWVTVRRAIPFVRKVWSRVHERFAEKRALVEVAVRDEKRLRDTVMAEIGEGEEEWEQVDSGFLEIVVEMVGWVQECKDECQLLDAEEKKIGVLFAELERYKGAIGGGMETQGGGEGSERVQEKTSAGESPAVGAPAAGEELWVEGDK